MAAKPAAGALVTAAGLVTAGLVTAAEPEKVV
jgi:hypothetical protein